MSNPRFSPITSDLLARKGDAVPSTIAGKPSLFWRRPSAAAAERTAHEAPPLPHDLRAVEAESLTAAVVPPIVLDGPRPHKMMVTLTAVEYEKLGIAAVKKGMTRHQILRAALDLHLERLKREYGGCGCMAMGAGNCGEGCGAR